MITAVQPEILVIGQRRSLEVRWILPGQPGAAVTGWFARFEAAVESREDAYLLDPPLPGLSVKLRNGRALEVKVYRGSPGILEVAYYLGTDDSQSYAQWLPATGCPAATPVHRLAACA